MYKIKIGRKYICFMSRFEFDSIKNSLSNALESLPDWARFSPTEKGYVIDRTFESISRLTSQISPRLGSISFGDIEVNPFFPFCFILFVVG
jgi:hypothetical protein